MKKNKVTLIIIAIILLAGLIIWYILHNKKEEDIRPVVEIEKVTTDDVRITENTSVVSVPSSLLKFEPV